MGRAARRAGGRVRERRGRLRLPDRGDPVRDRHRRPRRCRSPAASSTRRRWPATATARPSSAWCATTASGRVTIDEAGQAVPWYSLTDPLDVRNTHRALDAQVRLHVAAGAREIAALAAGLPRWRVGDDVERYIERLKRVPLRAGGFRLFAAHQMGTCRMGSDPQTSVAEPLRRAARHARSVDRRRERVPDPLGHQPDDHDHGPRPPHGRGDPAPAGAATARPRAAATADAKETRHGHRTDTLVRDKLYIGGEWVEPAGDGHDRRDQPDRPRRSSAASRGHGRGRRPRGARRARRVRGLVADVALRARQLARRSARSWPSAATSWPR